MSRYLFGRRAQVEEPQPPPPPVVEEKNDTGTLNNDGDDDDRSSELINVTEDQAPIFGVKVRRKSSIVRDYRGDYLDVPSTPYLLKILEKQGDKKVFFADRVFKFTSCGKMKRRILLITDFAIYLVDPEIGTLKRRVSLAAVEKICLSDLSDNFFAIIIPTEYDILMASTRKSEIITMLPEATKSMSNYEAEVSYSNSFEYNAAADLVKEIIFEEIEGGVKTRILRK